MALVDRIFPGGDIQTHAFEAAVLLYLTGHVTQQQVVNAFSLDSGEESELTGVKSTYEAQSGAAAKAAYAIKLKSLIGLGGDSMGVITKSQWTNLLGDIDQST